MACKLHQQSVRAGFPKAFDSNIVKKPFAGSRCTFGARLATVCPGARLRIQQEPAHGHPPAPHAVLPRSRNMINGRAALLLAGQQGFLHAVLVLGHRSLRLL